MAKKKKAKETKTVITEKVKDVEVMDSTLRHGSTSSVTECIASSLTQKEKKQITWEEYEMLVSEKAYSLFLERGEEEGSDKDDWAKAEMLVKEELDIN